MKRALILALLGFCMLVGTEGDTSQMQQILAQQSTYQEKYEVPKLSYSHESLEPWMDGKTVEAHHEQVHKERAFNMNKLLKEWRKANSTPEVSKMSLLGILKNIEKVPEKWREGLRNNVGGYVNHIFTSVILSPNPKGEEESKSEVMGAMLKRSFGRSLHKMFNKTSMEVFGNGYVWVCRVPDKKYLTISTGLEERNPISHGMQPLFGIDLWEHAYWAKYGNNRDEYINNWWKLVDYDKVEQIMNWWIKMDENPHSVEL